MGNCEPRWDHRGKAPAQGHCLFTDEFNSQELLQTITFRFELGAAETQGVTFGLLLCSNSSYHADRLLELLQEGRESNLSTVSPIQPCTSALTCCVRSCWELTLLAPARLSQPRGITCQASQARTPRQHPALRGPEPLPCSEPTHGCLND